jgi:hypothetical protein
VFEAYLVLSQLDFADLDILSEKEENGILHGEVNSGFKVHVEIQKGLVDRY